MPVFYEKLSENKNEFLSILKLMKESGLKICIYGAAQGAQHVIYQLKCQCIEWDKMLVDDVVENEYVCNIGKYFANVKEKINIIVAFSGFTEEKIIKYRDKIQYLSVHDSFCGNINTVVDYIDKDWIINNNNNLEWIFDNLEDELSKKSLIAYINEKISYKFGYLNEVYCSEQYFPSNIIHLKEDDVFVDCGAFDGDTIKNMYSLLSPKYGIKNIRKVYAIEADIHNFSVLQKKYTNSHSNVVCINIAVSDNKGELTFSGNNEQFRLDENGDIIVLSDTIDNIFKFQKISYIKMDIEGAELSALHGAEMTIKRDKPQLAICIYHKKEDIFSIAKYIKSIVPHYKFYIRAHAKNLADLVLYAIT